MNQLLAGRVADEMFDLAAIDLRQLFRQVQQIAQESFEDRLFGHDSLGDLQSFGGKFHLVMIIFDDQSACFDAAKIDRDASPGDAQSPYCSPSLWIAIR